MQKNDAKNGGVMKPTLGRPRSVFGAGGGVRRGQAPPGTGGIGFELLRSENALHPAGCGGYFLMKKRSLGAKGSIERLALVDF